jgi:hypothetical protein
MALPVSGAISFNSVNVELGRSGTAALSMNDQDLRSLFSRDLGLISMSDGHGKSFNSEWLQDRSTTAYTNLNLRALADSLGYTVDKKKVMLRFAGVIESNSTATPAMEFGSWPSDVEVKVELYNSCVVKGKGGAGGATKTGTSGNGNPGSAGGPAIKASNTIPGGGFITIIGTSVKVQGGGGGGGSGGIGRSGNAGDGFDYWSGGAGGTGFGPNTQTGGSPSNGFGGAGGTGGAAGAAGATGGSTFTSGGGGGAAGAAMVNSSYVTRTGWTASVTYWGALA